MAMRRRDQLRDSTFFRWLPLVLALGGGFTMLSVGTAVVDYFTMPRVGKPCSEHSDCVGDEFCVRHLRRDARYCTKPCAGDDECPLAMTCGDVANAEPAERGIGATGAGAGAPACIK
jgi:hypothetical protein